VTLNAKENGVDVEVTSLVSANINLPLSLVHAPVETTLGSELTKGKLLLFGVALPVSPVNVILGRPPGLSADDILHVLSSGTLG